MALIPTWPIAAICLAVGLAGGTVATRMVYVGKIDKMTAQHTEQLRQREVQRAKDEANARNIERQLVEVNQTIEQEKSDAINRVRADADGLIARLRKQADSKPASPSGMSSTAPTCESPAGGIVPSGSGEGVVRIAERAEIQRAGLDACYKAYDAIGR